MNKNIFLVSSYPNTKEKLEILKECLESLKQPEYDILLTTNYKINDVELYNLVDYIIFDKTDVKNFTNDGVYNDDFGWYMNLGNFKVISSFDNAHHYDIYRSTYNAISFVNSLGYEHFVYIEGDCILKEFEQLISLKNRMISENKHLFFSKIKKDDYYDYCTLLYGGSPSFYIKNTNIPYQKEDWLNNNFEYSQKNIIIPYTSKPLELIVYECFKQYVDDVLELDFDIDMVNILEYNKIWKSKDFGLSYILFFSKDKIESVYLFIYNDYEFELSGKIYIDDIVIYDSIIPPYEWILREYPVDFFINKKLKFIVFKDNNEFLTTEKNLTIENIEILRKIQRITSD